MIFSKGDIIIYDPGETIGSEIKKTRPAVVISKPFDDQAVIIPITSKQKSYFFRKKVHSDKLADESWAMCDHIRTISIERIKKKIDKLPKESVNAIIKLTCKLLTSL